MFPNSVLLQSNHQHLLLQGSNRLYLNTSTSVTQQLGERGGGVASSSLKTTPTMGNGIVSSPQWKVIPLPASYMVLNWPIQVRGRGQWVCGLVGGGAWFGRSGVHNVLYSEAPL